jgi:hypothetical protein
MYVNTKMIPVGTVPRIREGGWGREMERVNSSMIHLIHSKNLCKCHNVPPPSTTIKIFSKSEYLEKTSFAFSHNKVHQDTNLPSTHKRGYNEKLTENGLLCNE